MRSDCISYCCVHNTSTGEGSPRDASHSCGKVKDNVQKNSHDEFQTRTKRESLPLSLGGRHFFAPHGVAAASPERFLTVNVLCMHGLLVALPAERAACAQGKRPPSEP